MSMRFSAVFVLALAGAPLAAAQAGGHAHDHHNNHHHNHHHEHSASAEMESLQRPADGGKWATDEPLRQGMGELNEAFAEHHRAFEEGEFDSGSAAELADVINDKVNFMFANCSLPAEPDAELHKLLAAAVGAAVKLRESDDAHDGLHQLHQVLRAYDSYFEHPGWDGR